MNLLSAGPVYKRWWFWVGVVVLALGALYLKGYLSWKGEQYGYDVQNAVSGMYSAYLKKQSADLEAAYRADTYGGETPEETLRLFVEALEKKDFELAGRFYLIEQQEAARNSLIQSEVNGNLGRYIEILRGSKKGTLFEDKVTFEFKFLDPAGSQLHIEQLVLNPFTDKWKITEFQ